MGEVLQKEARLLAGVAPGVAGARMTRQSGGSKPAWSESLMLLGLSALHGCSSILRNLVYYTSCCDLALEHSQFMFLVASWVYQKLWVCPFHCMSCTLRFFMIHPMAQISVSIPYTCC